MDGTPRFILLPDDHPPVGHNTRAEVVFLRHLGKWSQRPTLPRIELLALYLGAAVSRGSWDGINADKVLRFAREEFQLEEKRSVEKAGASK